MAIIMMEGFELGALITGWQATSYSIIAARSYHSGSYCLQTAGTYNVYYVFTARDEIWGHIRVEAGNDNTNNLIFAIKKDSTTIMYLLRSSTNCYINAYVGASLVQTATIKPILGAGYVYSLQFHFKMADSDGRIEVKVDGVLAIDYTGDTKPGADTNFNAIGSYYGGAGISNNFWFDDIVLDDAQFPGNNLRIQKLVPTGAGNSTQWDPSTGSNWECVNEIPPSGTDYNYTNVVNEIDTFVTGNMTGNISAIKAVQVIFWAMYEGAPTPTHIRPIVRSGSTDYDKGVDFDIGSSWASFDSIWELNPADSQAWEEADVNAIECGYKSIA